MNDGRHWRDLSMTRRAALKFLLAASVTLSPGDGVLAARALALQKTRLRRDL
jgi:hypothetical protein